METEVFKKGFKVGTLSRTRHGAAFKYDRAWLASEHRDRIGVGFCMPPRDEPYEISGVNLHPLFENLLPAEGFLRRLAQRFRFQEHDLFSVLSEIGADTVGDLTFCRKGSHAAARPKEKFDPKTMSFEEIVEAKYGDSNREVERVSLPGAQAKMSATRVTLPLSGFGLDTSIIKLNSDPRFENAAENEHCFMDLAKRCGIRAARTKLIYDRDRKSALLVDRFDRQRQNRQTRLIHQEDGCQLMDVYSVDRDHVSTEDVLLAMKKVVASWPAAAADCMARIAYSYAIGNHDHHAKNWSVLEESPGVVVVSPAYDVLSTLLYGDHFMAITVNGKDSELRQTDLEECAKAIGAPVEASMNRVRRTLEKLCQNVTLVDRIRIDGSRLASLKKEIVDRAYALGAPR